MRAGAKKEGRWEREQGGGRGREQGDEREWVEMWWLKEGEGRRDESAEGGGKRRLEVGESGLSGKGEDVRGGRWEEVEKV